MGGYFGADWVAALLRNMHDQLSGLDSALFRGKSGYYDDFLVIRRLAIGQAFLTRNCATWHNCARISGINTKISGLTKIV